MYISIHTLLNNEHPYYRLGNIEVYLDGEKVQYAFELDTLGTLDDPRGWVNVYATDEKGDSIIDPNNPGELLTETLYGNVEVRVL